MSLSKIFCVVCACLGLFSNVPCANAQEIYLPSTPANHCWVKHDADVYAITNQQALTDDFIDAIADRCLDQYLDFMRGHIAINKKRIDDSNVTISYIGVYAHQLEVLMFVTISIEEDGFFSDNKNLLIVTTYILGREDEIQL